MASGVTGTSETQWLTFLMGIFALASPFVIFAITGIRARISSLESRIDTVLETANKERSAMEKRMSEQMQNNSTAQVASERTIWAAIEEARKLDREFRERVLSTMVTREDLVGLRADLKEHITSALKSSSHSGRRE